VEKDATEEAVGVAMVRAVGRRATKGIHLTAPKVDSSMDGTVLRTTKKRFLRRPLIVEAQYSPSVKGVSGLRDLALLAAERAKAYKNQTLECFACPRPSEDMIAFAKTFADPKMSIYLVQSPGVLHYNPNDHRTDKFRKLFQLAPPDAHN
jgi:hypothetical protein